MTLKQKITAREFAKFIRGYYSDPHLRANVRLGQAFVNRFVDHDPNLFYETDEQVAWELILGYLK